VSTTDPDPDNQAKLVRRAIFWFEPQTGVERDRVTPASVALLGNSPNPFAAETRIAYDVSHGTRIQLSIYAPTGRHVADLVNGFTEPGSYVARWDGRDSTGRESASGIYYYRLTAGGETLGGKMILLKEIEEQGAESTADVSLPGDSAHP